MKKIVTISIFFIILFSGVNITLAATTCNEKYYGYGQCASDCANLGSDYQKDTAADLCDSGDCCYKTGGAPSSSSSDSLLQNLQLQVPIFDVANINNLPEYIATIYRYLLIVLIPLAVIMIMIGGVVWITAGGDGGKIEDAKKYIISAFAGLIIGLFSYVLLSLVGINALTMPGIQIIDPARGDTLIIDGQAYSVEEGVSKLPAERRGNVNEFNNAACPSGQTSFQVFFTNYYTPEYGDKGGYMPNFFCNIAMQCSCPKGINNSDSCGLKNFSGGYHPCNPFPQGTLYCNKTASGKPPVGNHTIAADISRKGRTGCFKIGCQFKIQGNDTIYEVQDTGSAIKGTHMDLYVGVGKENLNNIAGVYTVQLVNPESCFK
jgi:3D (Asp-Asp-Asp) domain-containing protein